MKTQYRLATFLVLAIGSLASTAESNRASDDIPPITGKAVAQATAEGDATAGWTIALTLPRDTWRAIQIAMPKLDWPEPTWEEVQPGFREGTMNLVGNSMPPWFRVVDMHGKELGRDQILDLLNTEQTVWVSASGRVPRSCYLQLPTPAKAIVLLGPVDNQDVAGAKTPAVETAAESDIDMNMWTEEKSQRYFFELMQKPASFKIETEEEASKYLQGIWRLDKRAHVGKAHYVRADLGADVTLMCTDKWLVLTAVNGTEASDMAVAHVERVEPDEKGHLHVKTRKSITFDRFQPLDKDHMAVLAYDFIAVVQRVEKGTAETGAQVNQRDELEELLEKTEKERLAYSPDKKLLAHLDARNVTVWSVQERRRLHRFVLEGKLLAAAFSPDGESLVTADGEGNLEYRSTIKLWSLATGESRLVSQFLGSPTHFSFSPDGSRLAATSNLNFLGSITRNPEARIAPDRIQTGGSIHIWRVSDGRKLLKVDIELPDYTAKLKQYQRAGADDPGFNKDQATDALQTAYYEAVRIRVPYRLNFSPDSQRLIAVSKSGEETIFDSKTGKPLRPTSEGEQDGATPRDSSQIQFGG